MPPISSGPLTARELAAWRGLLEVHARLTRVLDAQMREAHGLALTSYEVLMFLDDAPGHRLRMAEIADRVLLSRSGLTRLVDRLEQLGYATRCAVEDDGRGAYAELTEAGLDMVKAARRTHREGIRALFLDRLSPAEQDMLGGLWARLLD